MSTRNRPVVPASTSTQPTSTLRHPGRQEKTPWKTLILQGISVLSQAYKTAALTIELRRPIIEGLGVVVEIKILFA